MQRITGTIQGVAPLLFSRFYQDLDGIGGKPTPEEQAKEPLLKCHRDENGVYIPADMFKNALLNGARAGGVKDGNKSYAPALEAILFCDGHLYLGKDTYDEVFPHWGRRPPRTGGAMMIHYPKFNTGWKADFAFVLTMVKQNTIQAVRASLDAAGLLVGIGSWRPEYGRFVVTDWQVS